MKLYREIDVEMVLITPKIAMEWLRDMVGNRKLRTQKVARLSGLLEKGRWFDGIGTIVFDVEGFLIDGQHRLTAIMESGIAARVLVVRGVHTDAKYWIDTGTKRSGGDALRMAGLEAAESPTASALALLLKYRASGHANTMWNPENEDLRDGLAQFPGIVDSVEETKGASTSAIHGSHGMFAFLHFVFSRQDPDAAAKFFRAVINGLGIEDEDDPRHLLRQRLLDEATKQNKINRPYVIKLAFKAWSLWRDGEKRKLLRVRQVGDASEGWPDIGPVPGVTDDNTKAR